MSYTYKLGNNGPTLEVDDEIKIKKEEFTKGGVFSDDVWKIWTETPSSSGISRIVKRTRGISLGRHKIDVNW